MCTHANSSAHTLHLHPSFRLPGVVCMCTRMHKSASMRGVRQAALGEMLLSVSGGDGARALDEWLDHFANKRDLEQFNSLYRQQRHIFNNLYSLVVEVGAVFVTGLYIYNHRTEY